VDFSGALYVPAAIASNASRPNKTKIVLIFMPEIPFYFCLSGIERQNSLGSPSICATVLQGPPAFPCKVWSSRKYLK